MLISASWTPAPITSDPVPRDDEAVWTSDLSLPLPLQPILAMAASEICSGRFRLVDGRMVLRFPDTMIRYAPLAVATMMIAISTRDTASAT